MSDGFSKLPGQNSEIFVDTYNSVRDSVTLISTSYIRRSTQSHFSTTRIRGQSNFVKMFEMSKTITFILSNIF